MAPSDEPAIWLPYGKHSVRRILPEDSPDQLRLWKIHYLVLDSILLDDAHLSLAEWMNQHHAKFLGACDGESISSTTAAPFQLFLVQIAE